jgi:hypothetical protein
MRLAEVRKLARKRNEDQQLLPESKTRAAIGFAIGKEINISIGTTCGINMF